MRQRGTRSAEWGIGDFCAPHSALRAPSFLSPLCSLRTPAARYMSADDIMAGKAVVEIAGDKGPFEAAVVASQGIVDRFAGRISAMAAKIESTLAPIGQMGEGLKKAFDEAGKLATALNFPDAAESFNAVAEHVGKITQGFGGFAESLKSVSANLANVGKSGIEGFTGMLGTLSSVAASIQNYIALLQQAAKAGKEMGESEWFQRIQNAGFYGLLGPAGMLLTDRDANKRLDENKADRSRSLKQEGEQTSSLIANTAKAADVFKQGTSFGGIGGGIVASFERALTGNPLENWLNDQVDAFTRNVRDGSITGTIEAEIERLKSEANIPKTPGLVLAQSVLRGSSAAADAIAKGQATRLTDDKEKNLDELKKHTQLLDQLIKTKQAAGAVVKFFNGN